MGGEVCGEGASVGLGFRVGAEGLVEVADEGLGGEIADNFCVAACPDAIVI